MCLEAYPRYNTTRFAHLVRACGKTIRGNLLLAAWEKDESPDKYNAVLSPYVRSSLNLAASRVLDAVPSQ
jgi:hypothetical protein